MQPPEETLEGSVAGEASVRDLGGYRADDGLRVVAKGEQVARYVVLRRIGAGAMGTVYLAYDPELDRRVALKLLRGSRSEARRGDLLREAQAMARLTHPQVVGVHDAGEHRGAVYIAMEYVEGDTLRAWLSQRRRSWREVLDKFLLAGHGVEAAHASGLIHRDFKPDNVMVSSEGRVRVMDFGLARPRVDSTSDRGDDVDGSSSRSADAQVGRVAGTPAYMPPEQAFGEELSPAADQFAFCVSLWEGIYGTRPFVGSTHAEILASIADGRPRDGAAGVRVPGWLRRAMLRGLQADPSARWPSMAALLKALESGRGRWRWQLRGALALAAAAPFGFVHVQNQRQAQAHDEQVVACAREGEAIDEVWNDEARDRLRAGLLSTRVGFAEHSVDTIVPWLDDYREAWRTGRARACRHATIDRDWDEEQLDRSEWCFEDRRLQLEATVAQITEGNATAARRAVRLASYLDPVEACLDPSLLGHLPAPPSGIREDIRAIRSELVRSDGLRHAGDPAAAYEVAAAARARAEDLGWPPLSAAARFLEGRCQLEASRPREATVTLTRAYFEAERAGSLEVAFRAARSLVNAHNRLEQHTPAEVWLMHADAMARDLPDPGGLDAAEGHFFRMGIHLGLGDLEAAAAEGRQALQMRAEVLGDDHPITAAALRDLGTIRLRAGHPDEALESFERAHAIWRDAVGPDHPHVADLLLRRGQAELALGRPARALTLVEQALTIYRMRLDEGHPTIASAQVELARAYRALGRRDDAARALERSLESLREVLGPRDRDVAIVLEELALTDRDQGRFEIAIDRLERARDILEGVLPPGHADLEAIEADLARTRAAGQRAPAPAP